MTLILLLVSHELSLDLIHVVEYFAQSRLRNFMHGCLRNVDVTLLQHFEGIYLGLLAHI